MMKYVGVFVFIMGFVGHFWIGHRGFSRTNAMGVQEFNSFFGAVFWRGFEWIVGFCSSLAILLGFMMFCVAYGLFV